MRRTQHGLDTRTGSVCNQSFALSRGAHGRKGGRTDDNGNKMVFAACKARWILYFQHENCPFNQNLLQECFLKQGRCRLLRPSRIHARGRMIVRRLPQVSGFLVGTRNNT